MDKCKISKPVKYDNLEVYVDSNFTGNWDPKKHTNCETDRYIHIYLINYGGCPIIWKYQLHI